MHSRTFARVFSRFARPGLIALALLGTARADDGCLFQPMSGACFLHDSGMEYIPSRLLGVQDVAVSSDRGDERRDEKSWTCSDPVVDCAEQAEKFSRRAAFVQHLSEIRSTLHSMRTWATENLIGVSTKAIKQWNTGAELLGHATVRWAANKQADQADCPWDRYNNQVSVSASHSSSMGDMSIFKGGNVFIFTFGDVTAISPKATETNLVSNADLPSVSKLPPRNGAWLEKTAFARDYCIFAPYPLADDAFPLSDSHGDEATKAAESSAQEVENNDTAQIRPDVALRLKRSVSLALAKGMAWLGNRLLESGATLENSVRIASESDGSLSLEVK